MPHARQQIREAIGETLTGLTTAGANVFISRSLPINATSLPALRIFAESEELVIELAAMGGKRGYRLLVAVEALARPIDGADDTLDTMCAEVQTALAADDTLGGLVKDLDLVSTEFEFEGETESTTGRAKMLFACHYRIDRTNPLTAIT